MKKKIFQTEQWNKSVTSQAGEKQDNVFRIVIQTQHSRMHQLAFRAFLSTPFCDHKEFACEFAENVLWQKWKRDDAMRLNDT